MVLIVPTVLFPPVTPATAQVTLGLSVPVTVAVKVDSWPVSREALAGEIETEITEPGAAPGIPPPQPRDNKTCATRHAARTMVEDFREYDNRLLLAPLPCRKRAGPGWL